MRYAFFLFVGLAAANSATAQDVKTVTPEPIASANWSRLAAKVEGPRGFAIFGKGIRINGNGQYELLVKVVPVNRGAFTKRYELPRATEYVVQAATVDCERRLVSLEKTAIYGADDKIMDGKISVITPSSRKEPVRPGSISEAVFTSVCVETTSLPLPPSN